jgi:TorA maturation chaperone TorD
MHGNEEAALIVRARERGESYALFARLLQSEVTRELLLNLRTWLQESCEDDPTGEGLSLLRRYLTSTSQAGEARVLEELAADYAGLFLNAGAAPVHPYESVYRSPANLLMQEAWDEVRLTYAAHGLALSGERREPEDYLGYEMEFMSHLCSRAIEACEVNDRQAVQANLQSQREFLAKHLLLWAPQFGEELVRNATTDFYRALGGMICEFLREERELSTN